MLRYGGNKQPSVLRVQLQWRMAGEKHTPTPFESFSTGHVCLPLQMAAKERGELIELMKEKQLRLHTDVYEILMATAMEVEPQPAEVEPLPAEPAT